MDFLKVNKLLYLLGIISILYFIILKLTLWKMAFSEFWVILGLTLIIIAISINHKLIPFNRLTPYMKKFIFTTFILGMIAFLIIEAVIIYNGTIKETRKPDFLLVLGAGLNHDKISASLRYRLNSALEFHKKYPDVKIVVSGGQGKDEALSEALAMKNFLMASGVPENLIITEDKSTNTYENFKFSKTIIENYSKNINPTITVITNNFHMFRAKYIGKSLDLTVFGYPAPCNAVSAPNFYVREVFASIKTIIVGR